MSRYHVLTDAERCELYDMVSSGRVTMTEAAADFGVSVATVSRLCRKFRLAEDAEALMADKQMFVAGNKRDGALTKRADQDRIYEGTCRLPNGKFAKKRFRADGGIAAKAAWDAWCEEVRARPEEHEPAEIGPEPFAKPEPAQKPEPVAEPEPKEEPEHKEEPKPQPEVEGAYLLANVSVDPPRFLLFRSMEDALQAQEEMERAARFMGFDPNVDVHEVRWAD